MALINKICSIGILLIAFLFTSSPALTQWSYDALQNNPVDTTSGRTSSDPAITTDNNGGYYIAWQKRKPAVYGTEIYAQHINANGTRLWPDTGVLICNARYNQYWTNIIPDGAGGAIICWQDERANFGDFDIYAQRINASGTIQWALNGVPVINNIANNDLDPQMISDGNGGAIITAWRSITSGANADIYCQRINASGAKQWTASGVVISNATNIQEIPKITSDGNNGAIIVWTDLRNVSSGNTTDIYAQRVDANGNVMWAANGVPICVMQYDNNEVQIVSDNNNGAYLVWTDFRNSQTPTTLDVYAQRISATGTPMWAVNGIPVSAADYHQNAPGLLTDAGGDLIIAWHDYRGQQSGIYAQRLSPAGLPLWTTDGVPVCTVSNNYIAHPFLVTDNNNGAFVIWEDKRASAGTDKNIYAQRITPAGTVLWTLNGIPLCKAPKDQVLNESDGQIMHGGVIKDGQGGAVITWSDSRYDSGTGDTIGIYISRLTNIPTVIPQIVNVSDKCQQAASATAKLLNPPTNAGVVIQQDGLPVTYNAADSSFIYFTSGITTPGNHLINVKYVAFPGFTQKDTNYQVIPAPAINISGTTTVNQGQSITISATVTNAGTGPAYQWQDSTQTHSWTNIPGATAPTLVYTPAATGDKLRCLLTSTAVCAPPSAITSNVLEFTVTILTALDPVPGNSYGIRYYPNPASQILTIDSLKLRDQWLSADIFGMDGKKTTVSAILSGQQKMQLNLGRLSAGVYTVVLRRKQGAAVYFKLLRL